MRNVDEHTTRNAAYAFILIFALAGAALFMFPVAKDGSNADMLKEMISTLRDAILFLVGFLFGSSMGSRLKDKPSIDSSVGGFQTELSTTTTTSSATSDPDVKP